MEALLRHELQRFRRILSFNTKLILGGMLLSGVLLAIYDLLSRVLPHKESAALSLIVTVTIAVGTALSRYSTKAAIEYYFRDAIQHTDMELDRAINYATNSKWVTALRAAHLTLLADFESYKDGTLDKTRLRRIKTTIVLMKYYREQDMATFSFLQDIWFEPSIRFDLPILKRVYFRYFRLLRFFGFKYMFMIEEHLTSAEEIEYLESDLRREESEEEQAEKSKYQLPQSNQRRSPP